MSTMYTYKTLGTVMRILFGIFIIILVSSCSSPEDRIMQDNECVECDLTEFDFSKVGDLKGTDLTGATIANTRVGINLEDVILDQAEVSMVDFSDGSLKGVSFKETIISSSSFNGGLIKSAKFLDSELKDVTFNDYEIEESSFKNSLLSIKKADNLGFDGSKFDNVSINLESGELVTFIGGALEESSISSEGKRARISKVQLANSVMTINHDTIELDNLNGNENTLETNATKINLNSVAGLTIKSLSQLVEDLTIKDSKALNISPNIYPGELNVTGTNQFGSISVRKSEIKEVEDFNSSALSIISSNLMQTKMRNVKAEAVLIKDSTFAGKDVQANALSSDAFADDDIDIFQRLEVLKSVTEFGTELNLTAKNVRFENNENELEGIINTESFVSEDSAVPELEGINYLSVSRVRGNINIFGTVDPFKLSLDNNVEELLLDNIDAIDLDLNGEFSKVVLRDVRKANIRGEGSLIKSLQFENVSDIDYLRFKNTDIQELSISGGKNVDLGLIQYLGVNALQKLSVKNLIDSQYLPRIPFPIQQAEFDGVNFTDCPDVEKLENAVIRNIDSYGRCLDLRGFGKTNKELRDQKLKDSIDDIASYYATQSELLSKFVDRVNAAQSRSSDIGSLGVRGNVVPKQPFREILIFAEGDPSLTGAKPIYDTFTDERRSGIRQEAYVAVQTKIDDASRKWVEVLANGASVAYQNEIHETAFNKSGLAFCEAPRIPSLPTPSELKSASEVRKLVDFELGAPALESSINDFENCVSKAIAEYEGVIREERLGLINLTVAYTQEYNRINEAKNKALAEERKAREEMMADFRSIARQGYDIDELITEEFLITAYLTEFYNQTGFIITGGFTSEEAKAWVKSIKTRVSNYLDTCLSSPFYTAENGTLLDPNSEQTKINKNIFSILITSKNTTEIINKLTELTDANTASTIQNRHFKRFQRCVYSAATQGF